MRDPFRFQVPMTALRWFHDSPDVGVPTCICSWCGKPIERGVPIRLYWERTRTDVLEARFHDACMGPVFGVEVQSFDDDDGDMWPDD